MLEVAIINLAMIIATHSSPFQSNHQNQEDLKSWDQSPNLTIFTIPIVSPTSSSEIATLLQYKILGTFTVLIQAHFH